MEREEWPALRLEDWEPTYLTLHRWTQIIGKMSLALEPPINHWWQVALKVDDRGLKTDAIPYGTRHLSMSFDFGAHRLMVHTSDKRTGSFALEPMTVADFYERVQSLLAKLDVRVPIWPVPVEVRDRTPFPADRGHASYDKAAVERLHRILLQCERVMTQHRGLFLGKCSPVHFFWGGFDLAVTRFSGKANPSPPVDRIMREAYSHEVISHGFWPGGDWFTGDRVAEPVFYAYALPEPPGFRTAPVLPAEARYVEKLGEFLLPYEVVRTAPDPDRMLLDFMESTYMAAATRGGWDVAGLRRAG
jgi:hypothetical protein